MRNINHDNGLPGTVPIKKGALLKISHNDFNLQITMDSGQVFGFSKSPEGLYKGLIKGTCVRLSQRAEQLRVEHETSAFTARRVRNYFDLDRDLSGLYRTLENDPALVPVLKLRGLRLIRQDSWEALACFIISSNNNVKRIQGIWKNLAHYFNFRDRPSGTNWNNSSCGGTVPGFPSAGQIASSHERILRELGLGYRAPFLYATARFVANNPVCLEHIRQLAYEEAIEKIICFPGIGPKVADCALLYGFQKYEAFPVDVWILRIMRKLYFKNRKISEKKIQIFGQKRWGAQAGYVQQYLFHGARSGIL